MTRIISANLNGIRSAQTKGFFEWMTSTQADVVCVQETKAQITDLKEVHTAPGQYRSWFVDAQKKGYSGVALFSLTEPLQVTEGCGLKEFDEEGRMVTAEFENLIVSSIYFPSGSSADVRQEAKYRFLDHFEGKLTEFKETGKEVVLCGDWNIAHQEIDLKNWKGNLKNSGFLPEERAWMTKVLDEMGWVDAYRALYPTEEGEAYTWWSNRGQARANNVGWRIDYQVVTPGLKNRIQNAFVFKEQKYSDHAPLVIDYDHPL